MADAIPSAPPTVLPAAAGTAGPVAVTVLSDGAAVAQLLDGALLEGQVQARAVKGVLEVMTGNGALVLKAAPGAALPPLAAGATLLFQRTGQGEGGQLHLLAVNGRALAGVMLPGGPTMAGLLSPAAAQGGPLGPAPQSGQQPQTAGMAPATLPGTAVPAQLGLTATVIRPALTPGAPGAPGAAGTGPMIPDGGGGLPPDLPAGTRLTVRIAGVFPAADTGVAAPAATVPQPASGPGRAQAAAAPAASVWSGDGQFPLDSGLPPTAGTTARLAGTVTAHPPGGHAVVQSPIGALAVPTHADLAVGSRILLDVVGPPQPPPAAAATSAAPPQGLGAQGWPALSEALDVLAAANQPQALEQLLRTIPQADTRLAASMAVFAGALREGRAKSLLPEDSVRGLEKAGRKELAAKLRADLDELGEDAGRPVAGGDWRSYTLPFVSNGFVEPIRLFVRETNDDNASAKAGGGRNSDQRFLLDFNLTHLGRLQLDGLVRREDKLFDLIIRTGQPLPPEMRRDILGIFANAGELVGTKGTVAFQAGGRWVEFPPALPAPTRIEA
jgi:hypothetical protein